MSVVAWADLQTGKAGPRQEAIRTVRPTDPAWARRPKRVIVGGVEIELFAIGALAEALGRSSRTIRRWEQIGLLPAWSVRVAHEDPRARHRRYSREWIEGLVLIAESEGILGSKAACLEQTRFTERAARLLQALAGSTATGRPRAPCDV